MQTHSTSASVKKPQFTQVSSHSYPLYNQLLDHRVHADFHTEQMDYRLRLLPPAVMEAAETSLVIDLRWHGQHGIAFADLSLLLALLEIETQDFDFNKLTELEQKAAFSVLQRMLEENLPANNGLVIHKIQIASTQSFASQIASTLHLALLIKISSLEHLSYLYLYLSPPCAELLTPLIESAPLLSASANVSTIKQVQTLEWVGCSLTYQELDSLELGDVLIFNQGSNCYRLRLGDAGCYALLNTSSGLQLMPDTPTPSTSNPSITNSSSTRTFEIYASLHQAYVASYEPQTLCQIAQQQLEYSQQQPIKTLYCNQTPFALAENIWIGERCGMRLQQFLS